MYKNERDTIFRMLKEELPAVWDGKDSIRYMKSEGCTQWRQMEWPGFYFQFMCETILSKDGFMDIPGPKYGNVEFDGFSTIPWDFKAHSIDPAKEDKEQIPTNGFNEVVQAIDEYGAVGFIIMSGITQYDDENQSFKRWHDEFKGGVSNYEKERVKRKAPSRRRKVSFSPTELVFVLVDETNIDSCGKFQKNFRNADGSARNAKILLDLKRNDNLIVYRYKF
ncbi:TPA: hypothetical protein vir323_00022 [Caudoviricetes sp. vir323]|uniref:Uncharacterized protein n=1 Tax=Caudoviricetes sp. vir323 TaxID=3068356 RepID=A0AA86XKH7_9CAUD|nr:TPA_asm: hypothetical protein vir323_00022 [Caudoviricetes sp. vir323]